MVLLSVRQRARQRALTVGRGIAVWLVSSLPGWILPNKKNMLLFQCSEVIKSKPNKHMQFPIMDAIWSILNKSFIIIIFILFQWIPMFYVLLSSIFLSKYLGPKPFLYLLIQPVVFFVIHLLGCSILVWICAVGFLMSGSHWITVALKANLLDGQVKERRWWSNYCVGNRSWC